MPTEQPQNPNPQSPQPSLDPLRKAADLFHEVLAAMNYRTRIVHVAAMKPSAFRTDIMMTLAKNERTDKQIAELAADGFEILVRELARLGATDVTIHECNPDPADLANNGGDHDA